MRILLLVFCLLGMIPVFPQDSTWKTVVIDENLTAMLPADVHQYDTIFNDVGHTTRVNIYRAVTPNTALAVLRTAYTVIWDTYDEKEKERKFADFLKGFARKALENQLVCTVTDTTIHNMSCKRIIVRPVMPGDPRQWLRGYAFLVEGRVYAMMLYSLKGYGSEDDTKRLMEGFRFSKEIVKKSPKKYSRVTSKELWIVLGITFMIILYFTVIRKQLKKNR